MRIVPKYGVESNNPISWLYQLQTVNVEAELFYEWNNAIKGWDSYVILRVGLGADRKLSRHVLGTTAGFPSVSIWIDKIQELMREAIRADLDWTGIFI